jgi:hypothetical protein
MSYKEVLNKVIDYSNLSIRKISEESQKLGKSISPAYISQLKNGKTTPATEEVNLTIAKICNYPDPEELVFEAYIENAPEVIKDLINSLSNFFQGTFLLSMTKALPENISEELKYKFNELPRYQILKAFSNEAVTSSLLNVVDDSIVLDDEENSKIIIPNIGFFRILDDSMEPTIIKGAKIQINNKERIGMGDIGLFQLKDEKYGLIRRYFEKEGFIFLVPDNKDYPIVKCNQERIISSSKVSAVITEFKSKTYDNIVSK